LKGLAKQIAKLHFKQIIYIGCCDKAVANDINILTSAYKINQIIKLEQFPETGYYSYVIYFGS
jgi:tRNA/tmRNA/rRNA uracil-C5-methylase (TrmA/RlmC/RlmD family)